MTESPGDTTHTRATSGAPDLVRELNVAREAGGWLAWAGIALGLVWLGAAAAGVFATIGMDGLAALPTATLVLAIAGALIPAGLLIMTGYMARTNRRASAANAIVLEAAARLLEPSASASSGAQVLADQMRDSAGEVDRSMAHAMTAMKAMAGEIGDERQRLEQVSYAAADNARDLSERLAGERNALEGLARELKTQIDGMTEAIPRQAELMVSAARMAGEEVAKADDALDHRMAAMTDARDKLSAKLQELDVIAADAAKRTEEVTFAVTRVEQKLDESRRTVEAAVRAGEMAAAAATSTGDALKDAVSASLDRARAVNEEINMRTRETSETAAREIAELRLAGEQAAQAVRAAGTAARAETDMIEKRLTHMSGAMRGAALSTENLVKETPAPQTYTNGHANGHTPEPAPSIAMPTPEIDPAPQPVSAATLTPDTVQVVASEPRPVEDELFEASADRLAASESGEGVLELGSDSDPAEQDALMLRQRFDDDEPHEEPPVEVNGVDRAPEAASLPVPVETAPARNGTGWSDMLADIDREDTPQLTREETAEQLISQLIDSGIRLPESLRPKDKKRIAGAARKGEQQRRGATLDAAEREVERVGSRLKNNRELMLLARDFVTLEAADALVALEQTCKTNRNASPRLAAFLLIDAAFGQNGA